MRFACEHEDLSADEICLASRASWTKRSEEILDTPWNDRHAKRLIKRLRRHQRLVHLPRPARRSFRQQPGERSIRPAVIIRKNSYGNRSPNGACTQAVLMSIYRTLKQRGHDPITIVTNALTTYLTTGILPPLPSKITAIR